MKDETAEKSPFASGKAWEPLVSTVMAVRNGGRFVAQAVQSVLLQSYPRVEVVVVENGSTDDTAEVLAGFGSRIRVIRRPEPGIAAARNAGIGASSGELVAFLDADDLWAPHKLARQVEALRGDPACGFVFGEVFSIDENGRVTGHWRKRDLGRPIEDRFRDLYNGNYVHTPTAIVRRECLCAVGGFREDLDTTEDYDLWLRLALRFSFRYQDEPLAYYRVHSAQFTQDVSKFERRVQNNIRILTTPPIASGMSSREKRIRIAMVYWQYARLYARQGLEQPARALFRRAVRTWPFDARWIREWRLAAGVRRGVLRLCLDWLRRVAGFRVSVSRCRVPLLGRGANSAHQRLVCVAVPQLGVPSETFIRDHIRGLCARVVVLHGGSPPERLEDGRSVGNLADFLKRNHVGAVLAEHGQTGASVAAACRAARVPLVAHFHGADAYDRTVVEAHRRAYAALFRSAARVVVVSREMESQLQRLGCTPEKIRRIPCGVDLSLFRPVHPGANPPVFCAVGRFVDKKGPNLTILAFAEALRRVPSARLVMVGDGPLLDSCRKLSRALGVSASIDFLGAVPHAIVVEVLSRSRAFVQHSVVTATGDREGLPVSILEACASGLPSIATAHSGIVEVIVDGENGFLVDETNTGVMAERMVRLCTEPELAERLGHAARETAEARFSLVQTLHDLSQVVEEAMDEPAARGPGGSG